MRIDLTTAELQRTVAWLESTYDDVDEDFRQIFFEGETDVARVLSRIWEQVARDTEILAGIKERKATLAERECRIEARHVAGKAALGQVLRAAHLSKFELPEVTLSVRDGKSKLEIVNKDAVPEEYQRATYSPDKTLINETFADADDLPNWLTRSDARPVVTARAK